MVLFADSHVILASPTDDTETLVSGMYLVDVGPVGSNIEIAARVALAPGADTTGITLAIHRENAAGVRVWSTTYDCIASSDGVQNLEFGIEASDGPGLTLLTAYRLGVTVIDASAPSPVAAASVHVRYGFTNYAVVTT